jgi:hypothetical protein
VPAYISAIVSCAAVCREKHGDYFGIGVAGYPEAHPDFIVDDPEQMKKNYWDSLAYLKEKVRLCKLDALGVSNRLVTYSSVSNAVACVVLTCQFLALNTMFSMIVSEQLKKNYWDSLAYLKEKVRF